MKRLLMTAALTSLVACAGISDRIDYTALQSDLSLRAFVGTAMVRTVSLPTYAAAEEVAIETAPGVISTTDDLLWADEPERAATLTITRHLDDILSATVGPEPWPFAGLPDVAIDIRVTQMLAGADGFFRLTGQYYVGGDGVDFRDTSDGFAITVPLAGEGTAAVAAAQSQAVLDLSEDIARKLGR